MEPRGRRGRRGRVHSCAHISPPSLCPSTPENSKPWSFLSSLYSFLILSSLVGVVYMMLEYHCNHCSSNCDLNSINKSIEDIAKNLAVMKKNYSNLEMKICRFSQELPKLEGQIEILEALANAIECKEGWDARAHLTLPNVDVFLPKSINGSTPCCQKPLCPKQLQNS